MARAHLITGVPGIGKTSLILSLLEALPGTKGGFYTREIREGSRRVGFQVADLSGREGVLAHIRRPGPPRVGHYGVDVKTFEEIGVHAVSRAIEEANLIVIDEIGKMELFSPRFQTVLFEVLKGPRPLLGTIVAKSHPVADSIKAHPGVRIHRLTPTNRPEVAQIITTDLARWLAG